MKNFKIWSLVAIMMVAFTSCGDPDGPNNGGGGNGDIAQLVNEWVLTSYNGEEPVFVVYIDFNDDNTYSMYQQVYSLNYVLYEGDYNVKNSILTGTYEDGTNWMSAYKVSVSEDGTTLTMASQDDLSVVSIYEATTIPEDVKAEAADTRAEEVVPFL